MRNKSERFEARAAMVKINRPILCRLTDKRVICRLRYAYGEGRVEFKDAQQLDLLRAQNLIAAQYIDNQLQPAECYPANPNGSIDRCINPTKTDVLQL